MAPHSQTDLPVDSTALIEAQIRECYGRVVYSHKTHEKCADMLLSRLSRIKIWQMILSSLTTAGFIALVFGAGRIGSVIGVTVSATLLVLNAYTKDHDLGERAQKHRQAAADLWLLREKYLSLITDLKVGEDPVGRITTRRDAMLEELHAVYARAPSTTSKAYQKAQTALQLREDMTFSDDEIDSFLPRELGKAGHSDARQVHADPEVS